MKYAARMTDVVIVPEGSFVMGCERGQDNERPCHRVWVDSFGIGRFPVTNREYKIFADDTRISMPDFFADPMFSAPDLPVVGVTWDEATAYCEWLSVKAGGDFRLPSEAEWERAARGGKENALYPWGDEEPSEKCFIGCDPKTGGPAEVGINAPNGFGLYRYERERARVVQRLLRLQLLSLFARAKSARPGRRTAARLARRLMAPSNQIQPLRRAQLAAAKLQICRLWISCGDDRPIDSFNRFKSFKQFTPFG